MPAPRATATPLVAPTAASTAAAGAPPSAGRAALSGRSPASPDADAREAPVLSDDAPHVLVVDDDTRIRRLLSKFLAREGYRVSVAADASDARRKMGGLAFDLMVVDWMMPGETGVELVRSLRADGMDVPVLMLTALAETDHRIEGLSAGSDDYLPKPFDARELLLRVQSLLRRRGPPPEPLIEQVTFGPFTFHIARRELRRDGEPVRLTDRERDIMRIFATRVGETIPRHELIGEDAEVGERTIDVQINRLRRKLENDPSNPLWLQTVRGVGYRLSPEPG